MENNNLKGTLEQLALAEAFEKALKNLTSTNSSTSLRSQANDALLDLYEKTGASSVKVKVNGEDVGTFSLTFSKPVDKTVMVCRDPQELVEWLRTTDEGKDTLGAVIGKVMDDVLKAAHSYGFLPKGCAMEQVCEPGGLKSSTFKIEPVKVAKALGKQLPTAVAGLITKKVE